MAQIAGISTSPKMFDSRLRGSHWLLIRHLSTHLYRNRLPRTTLDFITVLSPPPRLTHVCILNHYRYYGLQLDFVAGSYFILYYHHDHDSLMDIYPHIFIAILLYLALQCFRWTSHVFQDTCTFTTHTIPHNAMHLYHVYDWF